MICVVVWCRNGPRCLHDFRLVAYCEHLHSAQGAEGPAHQQLQQQQQPAAAATAAEEPADDDDECVPLRFG